MVDLVAPLSRDARRKNRTACRQFSGNTVAFLARATLATLTACRLGGPSADPEAYVSFPSDASTPAQTLDASGVSSPPASDAGAVPGATGHPDAGSPDLPGFDDGGPGDAGLDDGQDLCSAAASIAVCDPIHNKGCNPLQQCDVDPNVKSPPTGLCVFNGGQTDGGPCTSSIVSESCAPGATCVSGTCRSLCACDGDCMAGECCSDTSGPQGFRLCETCH